MCTVINDAAAAINNGYCSSSVCVAKTLDGDACLADYECAGFCEDDGSGLKCTKGATAHVCANDDQCASSTCAHFDWPLAFVGSFCKGAAGSPCVGASAQNRVVIATPCDSGRCVFNGEASVCDQQCVNDPADFDSNVGEWRASERAATRAQ